MDRAFVVGKVIDMKFNDLNPTSKVKKMLRKRAIKNVEEKTADYSDFLFTVCLAYGGREEIVDAVRKVSQEYASGTIKLEEIDTDKICNFAFKMSNNKNFLNNNTTNGYITVDFKSKRSRCI